MSRLLILIAILAMISCEKEDDDNPFLGNLGKVSDFNDKLGLQCMGGINDTTQYKNEVFHEDFLPKNNPCYTDMSKLTCANVMEWFHQTKNCPKDYNYDHLAGLNKCVWTVWTGWNFWNKESESTYRPEAIEHDTQKGILTLKMIKNPYYDPNDPLQCDDLKPGSQYEKYRNCPIISGGIDSKYKTGKTQSQTGWSMRYGRIVMKVKYESPTRTTYPALWMWHNSIGEGHPHKAVQSTRIDKNGKEYSFIGEIDILEHNSPTQKQYGFFSYHNWTKNEYDGGGSAFVPKGAVIQPFDWLEIGVEWEPGRIRFFVDDCVVHEVYEGQKPEAGKRTIDMAITETASFFMMNLSAGHGVGRHTAKLGDKLHIDEITIYE
jgi:hypothetical protein